MKYRTIVVDPPWHVGRGPEWSSNGAPHGIGLGGAYTLTTEHVLFARRGALKALERVDSSWWHWKRGRHSAKPEGFLDMVERVSPAPRLEMFARRQRLGWETWGNECFIAPGLPELAL